MILKTAKNGYISRSFIFFKSFCRKIADLLKSMDCFDVRKKNNTNTKVIK